MNDTSNTYGGYDTHITGCSQNQYIPHGILNWNNKTYTPPSSQPITYIENEYGNNSVIGCGFQSHQSSTTVNFSVTMPSISNTSGNNNSPKHPSRAATIWIKDANNNVVKTISTTVTYSSSTGKYTGAINTGPLNPGAYIVSVKLSNTLSKQFSGFFTSPIATVNESTLALVSGDINGDNVKDILDYNDLLSCYGSKFPSCAFNPSADLNDDGAVDGIDYNLWLRQ